MTNMKKRSAAALTAAILAAALTIPAAATVAQAESIRVSSYKGSSLEVGERSGLITGPSGDSASPTDNLEIRQKMIRLISQTRKDTGVSELPINDALMNAAQACFNQRYTWHHAPEESQAAADAGYPYGFGDNLTVFTGTTDAARRTVDNWINSPGHFETKN